MRFRYLFISLALLLFCTLAIQGILQYQRENRISVILLTVESLRHDLVNETITPNLLQAAKSSHRSIEHRAVSGWTGTNMISLLSGLTPFQAGVHTRGQSVDRKLVLPLEMLADKGYLVEGLQGFMTMDLYRNLGLGIDNVGTDPYFWLIQRARDHTPFFLWEHYLHTHLPYRPGNGYGVDLEGMVADSTALQRIDTVRTTTHIKSGSIDFQPQDVEAIRALHAANVREFDDWFARFWELYTKSGLRKRCLLIVTADHGDEHGERGSVGHASTNLGGHLYEEIVRVPLFMWIPKALTEKEWPNEISGSNHTDVMVTILSLLGIAPPAYLEGQNVLDNPSTGTWFGMTSGGGFSEEDPAAISYFEYGAIQGDVKLLWRTNQDGRNALRLYDLRDDPLETNDLYPLLQEQIAGLEAALGAKIQSAVQRPVREDARENLVGSGPQWLFPPASGAYSYEELAGRFYLEWQGTGDAEYVVQYRAGSGDNVLDGELEVRGARKDFGNLSKRFWQTWVVPASPVRVRVRRIDRGGWSKWLELEAMP